MMAAFFHLPGLFEFYQLYKIFVPLFYEHREYFYDWCAIGSIYGAPADCLWGGGRVGFGEDAAEDVLELVKKYGISARLTFSNSLLCKEHLQDARCNDLCKMLLARGHKICGESPAETCATSVPGHSVQNGEYCQPKNGVIVHSDLLVEYLQINYSELYLVSSTTKVIVDFEQFVQELERSEFKFVVPDFRLNKKWDLLKGLPQWQKDKVEFLCNECCSFGCKERKACYENVSRKVLSQDVEDHRCASPAAGKGYVFSKAMNNPGFIGVNDIKDVYMPMGFSNFKIEGRSLGSAMILEFLLHYMTKPEYQLHVREAVYLDSSLDLF